MEKSLIFEVGTEEVPARFIEGFACELREKLTAFLSDSRLTGSEECELYYTPRRVIFIKDGVKTRQEDEIREVSGPPVRICFDKDGKPQKAFHSFLQKYGITEGDCYRVQSDKGEIIAAKIKIKGMEASELLKTGLLQILSSLKFRKSMRWGNNDISFVRPVRWIVAILGEEIIPFEFAGVKSGRRSFGNYNADSEGFEVRSKDDFLKNLREKYVMYDAAERKMYIETELKRVFSEYKADESFDKSLLDEVVNLLEYPVTIAGGFEDAYLSLPSELLEVVQRHHQRYFPMKKGGRVLPHFVAFANNPFGDKDLIRKGMEKVLRARLNDAVFFYNEDRKKSIGDMASALNMVLYQRGLGNYDKKAVRIGRIAEFIGKGIGAGDTLLNDIRTASGLAKADLVSQSVGEFPELQGIMGKYFALNSGLSPQIADAIEEHYRPVQSGGELPQTIIGQIVAIADKADHLAGLFLINQKPTASSDPFGARRAASGIIEIIRYAGFRNLSVSALIDCAISGYNTDEIKASDSKITINSNAKEEILEFIRVRIKAMLSEEIKPDVAEALLNAESGIDDISSIFERKEALGQYIKESDFEKFSVVYKRASNITKDFTSLSVNTSLFEYEEEKALYDSVEKIKSEFLSFIGKRDYFNAMRLLKENLYGPIFGFFDKVYVMAENESIRNNRLALLKNVVVMFRKIIDLSYISSM